MWHMASRVGLVDSPVQEGDLMSWKARFLDLTMANGAVAGTSITDTINEGIKNSGRRM